MRATTLSIALVLFLGTQSSPAVAQQQQPGAEPRPPPPADGWPRSSKTPEGTFTVYPPQLETWEGDAIAFRAAASVQPPDEKAPPRFGVLEFQAQAFTDKLARVVELRELRIVKATFPSAPGEEAAILGGFKKMLPATPPVIALDRLEAQLATLGAQKKGREQPVRNDPPRIVFSEKAAALVLIDGEPAWRAVEETSLERILNTRVLVVRERGGSQVFLHLLDGWVTAPSLPGPWTVAKEGPRDLEKVAKQVEKSGAADLMTGPEDPKTKKRPSLKAGVPLIVVATQPTEVITFDGKPDWTPIEGTSLLFVKNTTSNVFRSTADQRIYVLISGRWFASSSMDGPWKFVPGSDLPPDFAKIPDSSDKENVKASVPGTLQAKEAAIAAQVPQTAVVYLDKATFKPNVSGTPILKPIEGTSLHYVVNSADPIVQLTPTQWYAVQNGVWFTAPSLDGPWKVATQVPAAIYSIPVSSPVHYVTYVRVYTVAPTYVVVGYTPGYMGAMVAPDGVVVYGTGYVYPAYVGPTVWYPPPVTYGYSVAVTYTPWTGWTFGFMAVGGAWYAPPPYWGPYRYPYAGAAYGPYGGAAAWGPGGWAATSGNVYSRWGSTTAVTRNSSGYNAWTGNAWNSQVGRSYNSVTGQRSAGQRSSVQNVYTGNYAHGGRGATYNPSTGVGAAGSRATVGNAYTGNQATAGRGVVTGPGGQTTSVAGVKGEQGSAARVGDNYYATKDGNVYRSTGSGSFEQVTPRSSPSSAGTGAGSASTAGASQNEALQREQAARQRGEQRGAGGWSGGGGGGARAGGGGARGGGRR